LFVIYLFVKERRAGKLALGVAFVFVILVLCELLSLNAMKFLLSHVIDVGLVLIVVIFQPEIRSGLEKIGDSSLKGIKVIGEQKNSTHTIAMIDEISNAIFELAKSKTGALIVFERNTKLGEIILTGTVINAQFSGNLLKSIFFNKAPLHDGAVVIRANRIHSAACILPLESDRELFKDLGTRHRAAIGISERCDAVTIIVSEETGGVSVTVNGGIERNVSNERLQEILEQYLIVK
jgi:diadenylate cyclase